MVREHYSFQIRVWRFTYKSGSGRGQMIFHSPQESWSKRHNTIILRPVGADAAQGAWANTDPLLVSRWGKESRPVFVDADGVIITDGWGEAVRQDGPTPGGALVSYRRGERIWVERSLDLGADEDGSIPVISLDSLEVFRIPLRHVCFVPQRSKSDEHGNRHYATTAVVVQQHVTTTTAFDIDDEHDEEEEEALQGYFSWPADEPNKLTLASDGWWPFNSAKLRRNLTGYSPLWDLEGRNRAFQRQWVAMTANLAAMEAAKRKHSETYPEELTPENPLLYAKAAKYVCSCATQTATKTAVVSSVRPL